MNNILKNIPARDTSTKSNKANGNSFPDIELFLENISKSSFALQPHWLASVPCPSLYIPDPRRAPVITCHHSWTGGGASLGMNAKVIQQKIRKFVPKRVLEHSNDFFVVPITSPCLFFCIGFWGWQAGGFFFRSCFTHGYSIVGLDNRILTSPRSSVNEIYL